MIKRISLLINCEIHREVLSEVIEHLKRTFSHEVTGLFYGVDITFSFNKRRGQYLGDKIIEKLRKEKTDFQEKWLLIMDGDLYSDGLNFIFGLADPYSGVSIVSITRLRQGFYGLSEDEALFIERLKKEATHELGHLFHLSHCSDKSCVMRFSNSLYDTDQKSSSFCDRCKGKIS